MKINNKHKIQDLSPHLFWDVKTSSLDWITNSRLLVERVLQQGFVSDWKILLDIYSFDRIVVIAKKIRNLDAVSLNFISKLSGIEKKYFKCYIGRQFHPTPWNS